MPATQMGLDECNHSHDTRLNPSETHAVYARPTPSFGSPEGTYVKVTGPGPIKVEIKEKKIPRSLAKEGEKESRIGKGKGMIETVLI